MKKAPTPTHSLPAGIQKTDLTYPSYKSKDGLVRTYDYGKGKPVEAVASSFELWHTTGFGWCIPTLHIANPSRRARQYGATPQDARTYAVTLDGKTVRIGMGPHVQERVTVYVRRSRLGELQKFLDLLVSGQASAQTVRDRISSRRAQGVLNRAEGMTSWRW